MNIKTLLVTVFSVIASLFSTTNKNKPDTVTNISQTVPWFIIDVRTAGEYASGHLKGATNIPYEVIGDHIVKAVPSKETPVLLYCRSGRRSGIAYDVLKAKGYKNITNAGGFDSLKHQFPAE